LSEKFGIDTLFLYGIFIIKTLFFAPFAPFARDKKGFSQSTQSPQSKVTPAA